MKLAWVCDNCNYLIVSDSQEHHQMDICPCGNCGVDLEEYGCRYSGQPQVIATLEDGKKGKYKKPKRKRTK